MEDGSTVAPTSPDYGTIRQAAAVTGINASATIESATVARGVYVLLAEPYPDTPELGCAPHLR